MAIYNLSTLKSRFNTYIKENFKQLITGPVLNGILHDIADSVNSWMANCVSKDDIRKGRIAVTEGDNPITFTSPFPIGTNYIISTLFCVNSSGETIALIVSNRTISGFMVNAVADGTLEYKAEKL